MGGAQRRRMVLTAVAALAVTAAIALVPGLRFTYVSATTRVAMETAQAVIAAVAAVLVHGRYRRSAALADLLLVVALGISTVGNLSVVVTRAATEDRVELSPFVAWSGLTISFLAALLYAAAAHLPARRVRATLHSGRTSMLAVAGVALAVWAVVAPLAGRLPATVDAELPVSESGRPSLDTSSAVLGLHLAMLVLFVAAAVAFGRRADRERDDLLSALSVGLVLAAVARLNFVLYPSIYTNVVHTGDVARLAFYLVLLGGAAQEVASYWRDRAQLAVLDERRRMARELHDGLAQELSFIRSVVSSFREEPPLPQMVRYASEASARALEESRRAIEALSDASDDALDVAVRRAVAEVADRAGRPVTYELAPGLRVPSELAEQVVRVAREATNNAVRHAGASAITVSLRNLRDRLLLVVADDGAGFDPSVSRSGYGLRTMRERAESVGGALLIDSAPDGGTRLRLEVPLQQVEEAGGAA